MNELQLVQKFFVLIVNSLKKKKTYWCAKTFIIKLFVLIRSLLF